MKIRKIHRSLHLQVCSVSKLVNQMFNVQILIYTFTTLVYISISTYWVYMEIQRKTDIVESLDLVLIFLLDGVVGTLKVAVMSYDCEYAMGQVKNSFLNLFDGSGKQNCETSHWKSISRLRPKEDSDQDTKNSKTSVKLRIARNVLKITVM